MNGIRARRKAERPGQILDAAFDEFVAKGYDATRLDDVAARIGVTKGTIYFYFTSKERLFEAALQAAAERAWSEVSQRPIVPTDDVIADINSFLDRLRRLIVENSQARESFRLLVAEGQRFPHLVDLYYRSFMAPVESMLRERLTKGQQDNTLRGDLEYLTEIVLSPSLAVQVMLLLFPGRLQVDRDKFFQSHVSLLNEGILAPRKPCETKKTALGEWSAWRRYPDPHRGEALLAPVGPGLFELRMTSGELLLFSAARSVVARIVSLVPLEPRKKQRENRSRRSFLERNVGALEYRTIGCPTLAEANALSDEMARSHHRYRF